MERFLLPLYSFPTNIKILIYSSFFMLIHKNSDIFILVFDLFTQKVVYCIRCSVTCFFHITIHDGNLFISGFFILLIATRNFIEWLEQFT